MKTILVFSFIIFIILNQSCDISVDPGIQCGHALINQYQCKNKGCCWIHSIDPLDTPKCIYPQGANYPCQTLNFNWSGGIGFDDSLYSTMYKLFDANINIQDKGGIVASLDRNTPGGSYYYHWMRDAGLTMRTYQQLNDYQLPKIQQKMKAYISFVLKVQNQSDPNGNDVRINPKFELPNGQVFVGPWCRPQTDGPALTAGALIMFANTLLDAGQDTYVYKYLWTKDGQKNGGAIKYDLDWIINNWQSSGCDLWEQVRSDNFFWNRMAYAYTLKLASEFAIRTGDSIMAQKYNTVRQQIQATLDGHWNGKFIEESSNRKKDGAVIHAFVSFPVHFSWTDAKVASTIKELNEAFCAEYQINQNDNKAGVPGILIGRYPGDVYAGGNPWQLLTAVLAELFYKGSKRFAEDNSVLNAENRKIWANIFKIDENASQNQFAKAAAKAGDAVLYRLYQYVKNDEGHIDEQINRSSGKQTSAKDLTWSFANIMNAIRYRNIHLKQILSEIVFQEDL